MRPLIRLVRAESLRVGDHIWVKRKAASIEMHKIANQRNRVKSKIPLYKSGKVVNLDSFGSMLIVHLEIQGYDRGPVSETHMFTYDLYVGRSVGWIDEDA